MSQHDGRVTPITTEQRQKISASLRFLSARLPAIAALFEQWLCLVDCEGEAYESEGLVFGPTARKLRGRDEYAIFTHAANPGAVAVEILEDGNLVLIVEPGESRLLHLQGYGEISGRTRGAEVEAGQAVIITTLRRCVCGTSAYVDDEQPIGVDLI